MFNIENSIPKKGTIHLMIEIDRINNFAKEFNNYMNLYPEDAFRQVCFDESIVNQITHIKNAINNVQRITDARKKKNIIGYVYVCLEEMGYMLFKYSETVSAEQENHIKNTAHFFEYVRVALLYRKEEWTQINEGKDLKTIADKMADKRKQVEEARLNMEHAIHNII